jgi:hypothetical protein
MLFGKELEQWQEATVLNELQKKGLEVETA